MASAGRRFDTSYLHYAYAALYGAERIFFFHSLAKQSAPATYLKKELGNRLLGLFIPMISFGLLKIACDWGWENTIPDSMVSFATCWFYSAKGIWFLGDVAVNTVIILTACCFCNGRFKHDLKFLIAGVIFSMIPYVTYRSPHMYFFFALGFCLARYMETGFREYMRYWKVAFVLFIAVYVAFSNMPWPPEDFSYDWRHQSLLQLILNDGLKLVLGILGSYLFLILLYRGMVFLRRTQIWDLAIIEGRHTMNIYLIQIVVIEKILGPAYREAVAYHACNWITQYGFLFKTVSTISLAAVILGVIIITNRLCIANHFVAKILFYK